MEELYKTFQNNKRLGIQMITDYFVNRYNIKTVKEGVSEVYFYKDGIYTRAEKKIESKLSELLGQDYSIHNRNEVMNMIHSKTYVDRADFNVDKFLINLKNGVYDLKTGIFTPHTPLNMFLTKIDTDYDPDATCEELDAFFAQLLELKDIALLKQWFGYCIFRDYFIKKALIMTGEKNTGKTTLIDLFVKLIGLENTSGVSLQMMAADKFSIADLYKKHVNIYDDMSGGDVKDSGRFKMVTGRSPISAEYKHGNRFSFYNYAKLTFACNRIPNVQDNDDDAYFDRWIVVKFLHAVDKPDKFLLDKIATPFQLSGLLNQLLAALNKLIVNQSFSYNKTHEEIKEEMLKSGSPVASFAYDCMSEAIGDWVSKIDLHFYYTQYAKMNRLPYVEMKKFGKEITKYARYCTEGRYLSKRGWNNLKINDEFKEQITAIPPTEQEAQEEALNPKPKTDTRGADDFIQSKPGVGKETKEELPTDEDRQLRERLDEVL